MKKLFDGPVYPICPSFNKFSELEIHSVAKYLMYLTVQGAKNVMTTAGTSQYNLLSLEEVSELNHVVATTFDGQKILGLPALSEFHLMEEIKKLNEMEYKNTSIIVLFPERYYSDYQVFDFMHSVCSASNYPVLLHGNPLKRGKGGTYEYSNELLKRLSDLSNFVGIKEEYSSIDLSINSIQDLDLEIIVAGGSMRRYWALEPFGATSFLTGVGSFNPTVEEEFYRKFEEGKYETCKSIIDTYETPLFNTFMKTGWHASMRTALKHMGFLLEDRKPFAILSREDKAKVLTALDKLFQ